jgi:phage terminase small subunit
MGVPKKLTEKQISFANILVSEEGRVSATEAAIRAGYSEESARSRASELQNPKRYPLVVEYISKIRTELLKKYDITYEKHLAELAKLRNEARESKNFAGAIAAEVARGKASGLYINRSLSLSGNLNDKSVEELEKRMKEILEDYKPLMDLEKPKSNRKLKIIDYSSESSSESSTDESKSSSSD